MSWPFDPAAIVGVATVLAPADPAVLTAATPPAPLAGATLRVGLVLLVLVFAAAVWNAWLRRRRPGTRRIEVLERAMLSRSASVTLVRVDSRQVLLGVSTDGVRLLQELDDPAVESATPRRFADVLAGARSRREATG